MLDAGDTKITKHDPCPQGTSVWSINSLNRTELKIEAWLRDERKKTFQVERTVHSKVGRPKQHVTYSGNSWSSHIVE